MRMYGLDIAALDEIKPADISSYLTAAGWDRRQQLNRGELWMLLADGDEFEVLLPVDPNLRDYQERIADLLHVLAVVEERPEADVFRDVITALADVQYIRTRPQTPPGTTPVLDGVQAFRSARDLLLAAASSVVAVRAQPVLPTRKPRQATDFLKRVRLGPVSSGSFVFSVQTPLPRPDAGVLPASSGQPFERRVSLRLHEAVRAAHAAAGEALREGEGIEPFARRIRRGVSADLCEALAGLGGQGQNPFEIRFAWATAWPMMRPTPRVHFSSHLVPILVEGARGLRSLLPEEAVTVTGSVVRLHRETTNGPGDITVSGVIEGDETQRQRRVSVHLPEAAYADAVRAHDRGQDVLIEGDLYRKGNRASLENVIRFQLRPSPE
jgi:hypothetical protein